MDTREISPYRSVNKRKDGAKTTMKATNIEWDVDFEEDENEEELMAELNLPTEIELPDGMEDEDDISDYISDLTGFCHYGFDLEESDKYFGLTEDRYNQMMLYYHSNRDAVRQVVNEWTVKTCNKGYGVVDYDGTGMLEIQRIYDIGTFENDEDAAEQAMKDGIELIPIEELPENFDRKYLGWIDTPENRQIIQEYCNKYCSNELQEERE